MKKYGVPVLVGLVIGGIASVGYLLWVRSQATTPLTSDQQGKLTQTSTPAPILTWTDPNGFSFQYPGGLSVNKHDEDKENYAHVEYTHPGHPGNLIVWGRDPAKGVNDTVSWVKSEKRFIGASVLDTKLGGQEAKKMMVEGITRMLVVGTVYDGIVWTVEAKLDDATFWTGIHTTIGDTFAFVPVKVAESAVTSEPAPVVDDVAVDEEEVVE